jgi:carbamoyltransferase
MPFAPAVLDTFYKEYFDDTSPSLYMQKAVLIKDGYQKKIPAAIHVDGTCRVQYVQKKISTDFWKIIKEFYKKTKIPIVLNTSFNRHGISTISHPRQAIEHLMEGCLDVLYLNRLKIKLKFPNSKKIDKKFYKKEEYLLTNENLLWRQKLNK